MTDSELGSFGEIGHRAKNTYLCLSLAPLEDKESLSLEEEKSEWVSEWVSEWNEENSPPVSVEDKCPYRIAAAYVNIH